MVTIQKFRGTKHYLMGNKDSDVEYDSNDGDKHKPIRVKKRQATSEVLNEAVQKKPKNQKLSPSDLMGKLEEFSDVWNDCPEIHNPKQSLNNIKGINNHDNNNKSLSSDFWKKKPSGKIKFESKTQEQQFKGTCLINSNSNWQNESKVPSKSSDIIHKNKEGKKFEDNCQIIQREQDVSNKAEEKRTKAVQEQIQLHANKKNIIKQALSSLDSGLNKGINKKIIFNDDNESSDIPNKIKDKTKKSKSSGKKQLFEEEGSDNELELKINSQFEGKKGQKLLALQSKFSSDARFTLDKRFAESGSDSEDETPKDEGQNNEKRKQFEILENIIGRPLKARWDMEKSTKAPQTPLLRFDPLREDHSQFIVKPSAPKEEGEDKSSKKKKKSKKTKEENSIQPENRPEFNIERFYEVKDELKDTFRKEGGQEFSLLKLFGHKDPKEPADSRSEQSQSVKKQKHKTKSPFKYDSSDSETEEIKETEVAQCNDQSKDDKSEPQNKNFSWYTSFFFVEDDPRFGEALEFLNVPEKNEDDKSEYVQTRKTLKDFLKRRYKNNLKNKGIFKKKLGGGKQGGVRKKKGNKS